MVHRPGVRSDDTDQLTIEVAEQVKPAVPELVLVLGEERIVGCQSEGRRAIFQLGRDQLRRLGTLTLAPLHQGDLQFKPLKAYEVDTVQTQGQLLHVLVAPKGNQEIDGVDLLIILQQQDVPDMTSGTFGISRQLGLDVVHQIGIPCRLGEDQVSLQLLLLELIDLQMVHDTNDDQGENEQDGQADDDVAGGFFHFT